LWNKHCFGDNYTSHILGGGVKWGIPVLFYVINVCNYIPNYNFIKSRSRTQLWMY